MARHRHPVHHGRSHQAAHSRGGRVLGVAVDGEAIGERVLGPGRGGGGHRQRGRRTEAAGHRDLRADVQLDPVMAEDLADATRAARCEGPHR